MNLIEIIQTAANELGLAAPVTVANATDLQVIQLLALTNRDCTSLYREYDWTDLQEEFIVNLAVPVQVTGDVFAGSAIVNNIATAGLDATFAVSGAGQAQAQRVSQVLTPTSLQLEMVSTATASGVALSFAKDTYNLPTDFDRYIGNTWWDRTNHWRLIGPDSPQMDEYIRSGIFTTGPRRRWRQVGKRPAAWRVWPPPFGANNAGALVFEYISKNWCLKDDGTTADKMTVDTDVPLIDEQLVVMGVKWRMWQIKGFEYAAMQQEYLDAVRAKFSGDGGIPDLYLNRRAGGALISNANLPDGNWPGPS